MTLLQKQQNLILIGMPGAGKSTIGVILAKLTSRGFVDTDLLIQTSTGRALQDIVDRDGYEVLRRLRASPVRASVTAPWISKVRPS